MKKFGIGLSLALVTILLTGSALAQNVGDNSVFFVTYYSNANTAGAPDATLRLINDGDRTTSPTPSPLNGYMYPSIYVFDDSQELLECCGCYVSADGILSESVNVDLTSNPLTGRVPARGVIKVISNSYGNVTSNLLKAGIRGWMTHVQLPAPTLPGSPGQPYPITETPLADSNLVSAEQTALESSCSFLMTLGSGQGVCTCTPEDTDF
jgi:hypothetical protein